MRSGCRLVSWVCTSPHDPKTYEIKYKSFSSPIHYNAGAKKLNKQPQKNKCARMGETKKSLLHSNAKIQPGSKLPLLP